MPGDHGLWLDQDQAVFPAAPATQDQGPEGPVQRRERQASLSRAFQDVELVPEGQNLSREGRTRANAGDDAGEEESDEAEHREKIPEEGGPRVRLLPGGAELYVDQRDTDCGGAPGGVLARHTA